MRVKKCGAGICFVPACGSCCDKSSDYLHRLCTGILFAVVFGLIAYLMIMAQNTEFEYSYFDGELRFAKIKNKSRRKRLGIYSMESVAAIAPQVTEVYTITRMEMRSRK